MSRRLAALIGAAALCLSAALPASASAADTANDYTWTESYIPTGDPTIELHADVLRPKNLPAGAKTPVIMVVSPYLNHGGETIADPYDPTRSGPMVYYDELNTIGRPWANGYTVVLVDLPGFGGSSGCNDFGGVREQGAVKTAVEWAADQTWSTGKVGLFGKSYDGWTVIMGMATKPRGLAAVAPEAAIIDGYRTLYMNGLHYGPGWWATPAVYQAQDAMPGTINDTPTYWAHIALGTNPACEASNIALQNGLMDKDDAIGFWAERDLVARARTSTVPTFWEHGFLDVNAKPDNFMDVWSHLPVKRGWFGQWPHDRPTLQQTGRDGYFLELMRFFDRYLKGDESSGADDPVVEVQDNLGRWRSESDWPPADSAPFTMAIRPGSYTDDSELVWDTQTWSISQALPYQVHLSGVPKVSVDVDSGAVRKSLVVRLYDIAPGGSAQLITRGGSAVTGAGKVAFELYPQDWKLLAGHRIGVRITGADSSLFTVAPTLQEVTVTGGSVSLPALAGLRKSNLSGKASPAIAAIPKITVDEATIAASSEEVALPPQQQ
jgi:predicted acyl esterase